MMRPPLHFVFECECGRKFKGLTKVGARALLLEHWRNVKPTCTFKEKLLRQDTPKPTQADLFGGGA